MTTQLGYALTEEDISLTHTAESKLAELIQQVDERVAGVRVYAAPGGCSGISFGMTFTDRVDSEDAMNYIRGVEIDFIDRGNGDASFVFNNLRPMRGGGGGSGSGSCGSGGGCG